DCSNERIVLSYKNDDIANSVEVKQWESGKSLNEIAANQGIRIRRSYRTNNSESLEGEHGSPRNILEKIIWDKEVEVLQALPNFLYSRSVELFGFPCISIPNDQLKERKPLTVLNQLIKEAPLVRDFVGALKASYERTGLPALIAEVKKASPSKGVLRENFDAVQIAQAYEKYGAACLSILTDEKYFQGSFENLEAVRKAGIKCPLLCKEFIIDSLQIYYARSKGADAILLIAGVLPDIDIKYMTMICRELGLAALVEVHNEREMDRVLGINGIQLIGINNRGLETFEVGISNTKKLLEGERGEIIRQRGIIVVGESGLFTPEDISYVQDAGVRAVLVGESLVKQCDPGRAISGLFGKDIS
ncbi:Indole-3-glycerol phosphate synthase, chloroplastic, partial [Ananas comosus]